MSHLPELYSHSQCCLCPRMCRADRSTASGYCKAPDGILASRAALHFWEEPCISGTGGSGAIFFSGCTLRCCFCQNYKISRTPRGKSISSERLAEIFLELQDQGAHNINLVNPTHFVPAILESFQYYRPKVPVVYNSSGYEKVETLKLLEGKIDVYLPDLKYFDPEKARRYSGAPDYFQAASKAVCEIARQTGKPEFDEDGMLVKGTVVRHLVLPLATQNAIEILRFLKETLDKQVLVSLMGQYVPYGRVRRGEFPELNRRITKREYEKVQEELFRLDLNGFVQELSSAKKDFIPSFDLTGVERGTNQ